MRESHRPRGRIRLLLFAFGLLGMCWSAFATDPNPPTLHSNRGAWPIRRQWTVAETRHFGEWIQHIYEVKSTGTRDQRLAKLERVLTDPKINLLLDPAFAGEGCNPQMSLDTIRAMHRVLDCAKLTVSLSTYYAYRRALPWMEGQVRACDGGDVRTAAYTEPVGSFNSFDYHGVDAFVRAALKGVCTGNFRVELNRSRSQFSDTVPVAITRQYLIPGCLYYLDGHVLILASITADGAPRFLDATTSPTRDIYAYNGFNAVSDLTPRHLSPDGREYDGCYRGFRVYRWPIAEVNSQGEVTGVRRRTDAEMKAFGFSTDQYDRLEELATRHWTIVSGVPVDTFQQFFRLRMRTADRIDLVSALKKFAADMLARLKARERTVQAGWRDVTQYGPITFPENREQGNVFTAGGRWGEYATALTDAGLRARYFALLDHIDCALTWFDLQVQDVNLEGLNKHAIWTHADLAAAILRAKDRILSKATFEYTNSLGRPVRLSLLDIEKRLYDLSFDPNQPPELRWGAPLGSAEARSAVARATLLPDGKEVPMLKAYSLEAYYRSLSHWEPGRSYLVGMFTRGFSLRDRLDAHCKERWYNVTSPPLVPHEGLVAWLKEQPVVAASKTPLSTALLRKTTVAGPRI